MALGELVVAQVIPSNFILHTSDLVEKFHKDLLPHSVSNYDLREIINQISDEIDAKDRKKTIQLFRSLPQFNRIACKQFLDTVERQHLLKAATFDLAVAIYDRLEEFKAFDSYRFANRFPYAFEKMVGNDVVFFHIPY